MMWDTVQTVTIGGLLHDLGKVLYRSSGKAGRSHSKSGCDFIEHYTKNADLLDCIRYHHKEELLNAYLKKDSPAYIVYIADNISSGMDRRDIEGEPIAGFDKNRPLESIYNLLNNRSGNSVYIPGEITDTVKYPESEGNRDLSHEYQKIFAGLSNGLRAIQFEGEYINSLLELTEAYLSYIPSSTHGGQVSDISLYDHSKITAAFAACIALYLKSNEEHPVGKDYDIELEWELNEDNGERYEDRCSIVESKNFNAIMKKEIISKLIAAYDYKAALSVAETITDYIPEKAMKLIMAGERRLALDTGIAIMYARSVGHELIPGGINNEVLDAYEYILNMQIKLHRGELADFLRAISPVLRSMFEMYLVKRCGIEIYLYYKLTGPKGKQVYKLSRDLLPQDLLEILDNAFGGYRDTPPSAAPLLPIIIKKGDVRVSQTAIKLRDVEEMARNIAAHEVISISDPWIKQRTGYESAEILKMLKEFLSYCAPIPKDAWNSYDKLNQEIISTLML